MKTGWRLFLVGTVSLLGACGDGGSGRPDTGYGKAQPVPAAVNCTDLCQRATDCAAHLCDEDTNSTRYLSLAPILNSQCQAACVDAQVSAGFTAAQWQCFFQDSCRQVFGEGACGTSNTYYTCN